MFKSRFFTAWHWQAGFWRGFVAAFGPVTTPADRRIVFPYESRRVTVSSMSLIHEWERHKDPDEYIDYEMSFATELDNGDSISSYDLTVVRGTVEIDDDEQTGAVIRIWFSGGTLNESCDIQCRAYTAGGRTIDRTARLFIRAR